MDSNLLRTASNPPLQTDGRVGRPPGSLSRPPLNGYIVIPTESLMSQTIGACRLCLMPDVPLMDSHIMPKWSYRRASDVGASPEKRTPIFIKDDVAVQTSFQLREHLLCHQCEGLLGRYEDYVARLAYQLDGSVGLLKVVRSRPITVPETDAASLSGLDVLTMARFAASVFWRAHVFTRRSGGLQLWNPQAESLRRFVLGERHLPTDTCINVLALAGDASSGSEHHTTTVMPTTAKNGDDGWHQFAIAGLVFDLAMGPSATKIRAICLACSRHDDSHARG